MLSVVLSGQQPNSENIFHWMKLVSLSNIKFVFSGPYSGHLKNSELNQMYGESVVWRMQLRSSLENDGFCSLNCRMCL